MTPETFEEIKHDLLTFYENNMPEDTYVKWHRESIERRDRLRAEKKEREKVRVAPSHKGFAEFDRPNSKRRLKAALETLE